MYACKAQYTVTAVPVQNIGLGSTTPTALYYHTYIIILSQKIILTMIIADPTAVSDAGFGQGVGPIHLANVYCRGDELQLLSCSHNGVGNHGCRHYEDAGIICSPGQAYRCCLCYVTVRERGQCGCVGSVCGAQIMVK